MTSLHTLKDESRSRKSRRRVGRGVGSGLGKTCGRGTKGMGARSGYKRRWGYEGGQMRLHMKLPIRGFTRGLFLRRWDEINLREIDILFSDGEVVNLVTLAEKGFLRGSDSYGVKVLGIGTLTKKVSIEVQAISSGAKAKLESAKILYKII